MQNKKNDIIKIFNSSSFDVQTFQSMQEICNAHLTKLGFTAFEYARVYNDNTALILYTDPNIATYIVENEYHISAHAPEDIISNEFWYSPSHSETYVKGLSDIKEISNASSCINYIRRSPSYYEMFCFLASDEPNKATMKFINAKESLEFYSYQFIEKAQILIDDVNKDRFKLTDAMLPNFNGLTSTEQEHTKLHFYIQKIQRELIKLNQHISPQLSQQELKCINLLFEGKTATDIANILHLSPRTIEMHLNSARQKLNCSKKSDIIETLIDISAKNDK